MNQTFGHNKKQNKKVLVITVRLCSVYDVYRISECFLAVHTIGNRLGTQIKQAQGRFLLKIPVCSFFFSEESIKENFKSILGLNLDGLNIFPHFCSLILPLCAICSQLNQILSYC